MFIRKYIAALVLAGVALSTTPVAGAQNLSSELNSSIFGNGSQPSFEIPSIPDLPTIPSNPTNPVIPEIPSFPKVNENTADIAYWENRLFNEINHRRAQENIPPLNFNQKLHADGRVWSNEMSEKNIYHHDYRLKELNQGENIWMTWDDTPANSTQVFMDSPSHRANIMHSGYTQAAVSLTYNKKKGIWYIVHRFAR